MTKTNKIAFALTCIIGFVIGLILFVMFFVDKSNAQERVLITEQKSVVDDGNCIKFMSIPDVRIEKDYEWIYQINMITRDTVKYKFNVSLESYFVRFNSNTGMSIGEFYGIDTDTIDYIFDGNENIIVKENNLLIADKKFRLSISDGWFDNQGNRVKIDTIYQKFKSMKIKFDSKIKSSHSDSIRFQPASDDTEVESENPTTNYGAVVTNYMGYWTTGYAIDLVKFANILKDNLVGKTIDSSFFGLKIVPNAAGNCTLFVFTPTTGWAQLTATFNNKPPANYTYVSDTLIAVNGIGDVWLRFNVKRIADAYNTGGALEGLDSTRGFYINQVALTNYGSNNYCKFYTSDHATTGNRPFWVSYYHTTSSVGYQGYQPLYDGKYLPLYNNGFVPIYRKP